MIQCNRPRFLAMVLLMTHVLYNDRRVSCPVCGANATVAYLHPDAAIYRCGGCTHVFSDPRSIQKHETYSTEYYEEAHRNWFQQPNVRLFRWIADQIPPQTRSVIDIGCGKGHFLRFLHSVRPALKLVGVDLSRNDAETGIEYYQGEISDVPITEKFDVVVSLAVIEHVADVSEFAKRLATLCRPEGQVLIMTLDNDSMLYRVARLMNNLAFRTAFNRLYSTHHLHHFTERSLRSLLESAGISVRKVHRTNAPLRAVDVPTSNKLVRQLMWAGVAAIFLLGSVTRSAYLQTMVGTRR